MFLCIQIIQIDVFWSAPLVENDNPVLIYRNLDRVPCLVKLVVDGVQEDLDLRQTIAIKNAKTRLTTVILHRCRCD